MSRYVYLFAAGHLSVDWCQGAIPALLPYFISEYHLSYQEAAWLVFAYVLSASVIQPIIGWLSDKVSRPWFIPMGPVLVGLSVISIAFSTSYAMLFASALVSGVGVAIYHPEAALMINRIARNEKGRAMGTFSVGGNAGFAVGPVVAGLCAYAWGMEYLALFGALNLALALFIYSFMGKVERLAEREKGKAALAGEIKEGKNQWKPFGFLSVAILVRSMGFSLCNAFIPLYWIHVFGGEESEGAAALSVLFLMGAFMTYSGGLLADRFGMVRIVRAAFLLMIPVMFLFTHVDSSLAAWFLLLPMAISVFMPYSPIVVLGQTYLARNVGFASGVTLGLNTTLGGITTPIVGWAADQWGLQVALQILWIAAVAGLLAAMMLPRKKNR